MKMGRMIWLLVFYEDGVFDKDGWSREDGGWWMVYGVWCIVYGCMEFEL